MRNGMRCLVFGGALLLVPGVAGAQQPKSNWQQTADNMAEARKHYDLGLKLYEDGNYEAARIEFERAFSIAPSYRILYNIGLAYRSLNNYVDALNAFEHYLQEGGSEIPKDRRDSVEKEIAELRPRIARVNVTTNVPGAEISVDGVVVGKAPLAKPLAVNPGLRKITAGASGYLPVTKTITVASSEQTNIDIQIEKLQQTQYVERKRNPWVLPTVIGWSATGAAAIATGVVGALSLGAKNDQEDKLGQPGVSADELNSARDKTQTLSGATDVLLATTIVFAGVSGYFTYRLLTNKPEQEPLPSPAARQRPKFDVGIGPGGFAAMGTF